MLMTIKEYTKVYLSLGATEADMDEIKHIMSIGLRRVVIMQVIGMVQVRRRFARPRASQLL